jgi:hypothetical protein
MTSPYNLRPNPRKSTKLLDNLNEGDRDFQNDDTVEPTQTTNPNNDTDISTTSHTHTPQLEDPQMEEQRLSEAVGGEYQEIPNLDAYKTIEPTLKTSTAISDVDQLAQIIRMTTQQLANEIKIEIQSVQTSQTKLQNEIQSVQTSQTKIQTEILHSIRCEMKQQYAHLENILTHKIQENITTLESKIDEKIANLEEKNQNQCYTMKTELTSQIHKNFEEQNHKIKNIEEQLPKININTEQTLQKQQAFLEEHIDSKIQTVTQQINTHIQAQEVYNVTVQSHAQALNQMEREINHIKENTNQPNPNQLPEIIVNYIGDNSTNVNKIPHFHSKTKNPPEFLEQFDKYYEAYSKRNTRDCLTYLELIEQCFEGTTSMWFQIIKSDIKSIDDFKSKFLKQFWSSEIQRQIKKRIEIENYRSEGKLTMAEYFIDRTLTLKSMIPPLDDLEIIDILSHNFNEQIRASVSVQNIQTFERFIELLNREDMHNKTERVRRNSNEYRPNQNSPNTYYNKPHRNEGYEKYNKYVPSKQTPYQQNYNPNYQRQNYRTNHTSNNYTPRSNTAYVNRDNQNRDRRQDNEHHQVQHIQVEQPNRTNSPNRHPTEDQVRWTRQLMAQRSDTNYNNNNTTNNKDQHNYTTSPSRTSNTRDTGSEN